MGTRVEYRDEAFRALRRMPKPTAERIMQKIDQLAEDRRSLANNVKILKGYDGIFRLRVGDWRVLYRDNIDCIQVLDVEPRGEAYKRKEVM